MLELIGEFVGEGLILGTVDRIEESMHRIESAAAAIPNAMNAAGGMIGANSQSVINNTSNTSTSYYNAQLPINFENVDMRGQSDIVAVSENLAFIAEQSFAAKGGRSSG